MCSGDYSRAFGGWLAGCGAATAVVGVFTVVVMGIASAGDVGGILAAAFPLFLVFPVICVLTSIPAAIVIWVSEKFRIRAIGFFGSAAAGIGGASVELLSRMFGRSGPASVNLLFAVAGLAAGLVYWRVAGRYAGCDRESST
jgi:hypothetical protein